MNTLHSIPEYAAVVVIDMQERLCAVMPDSETLAQSAARLIAAADILACGIAVTEQYPKGLGNTVATVQDHLPENTPVFEKTAFSCWGCKEFATHMQAWRPQSLILAGVETHVCVQQTALDAVARGYKTIVPVDAVASRHELDKQTALRLLAANGVTLTTVEALVFDWLGDAAHPRFKDVSALFNHR